MSSSIAAKSSAAFIDALSACENAADLGIFFRVLDLRGITRGLSQEALDELSSKVAEVAAEPLTPDARLVLMALCADIHLVNGSPELAAVWLDRGLQSPAIREAHLDLELAARELARATELFLERPFNLLRTVFTPSWNRMLPYLTRDRLDTEHLLNDDLSPTSFTSPNSVDQASEQIWKRLSLESALTRDIDFDNDPKAGERPHSMWLGDAIKKFVHIVSVAQPGQLLEVLADVEHMLVHYPADFRASAVLAGAWAAFDVDDEGSIPYLGALSSLSARLDEAPDRTILQSVIERYFRAGYLMPAEDIVPAVVAFADSLKSSDSFEQDLQLLQRATDELELHDAATAAWLDEAVGAAMIGSDDEAAVRLLHRARTRTEAAIAERQTADTDDEHEWADMSSWAHLVSYEILASDGASRSVLIAAFGDVVRALLDCECVQRWADGS